ncbi:glycoside hydrolase family 9 protein [Mucilaginibacter koreensis]
MKPLLLFYALFIMCKLAMAQPDSIVIHLNQVAFEAQGPKIAVISTNSPLQAGIAFIVKSDDPRHQIIYTGSLTGPQQITDWAPGKFYYQANFSPVTNPGKYVVTLVQNNVAVKSSAAFQIDNNALAKLTLPSIIHYYHNQRANTPQELEADRHLLLYGSNQRVDLHGGWCDASGDVSKYFSHLAYANFVSPQQIPLVTWTMLNAAESMPKMLTETGVKDSIDNEALYGADYLLRSLSKEDYFYMIVFSYFKKDPEARRIVGLLADSKTTNQYQAAFREGGGMAIAALARAARWPQHGEYTQAQYLTGAKRAFAHLLVHNKEYDDDGRENIIDDYCALMAATELWNTTHEAQYQQQARKRAANLTRRLVPQGYFVADDGSRPFWHAADAGMPVVALCRYLELEKDTRYRNSALATIKKAIDYNLRVTQEVSNPFMYARQTFRYHNQIQNGFFIPHENETGWWWQGEDARLASLAAAAITGGRLVYPDARQPWGVRPDIAAYAARQLDWILGSNPYDMCMLYGFGQKNVPYMSSNYGHGSQRGGISNGITGGDGHPDGSGIAFKTEAAGNEWRWTEQWLPHAAWFLQAVAVMAKER